MTRTIPSSQAADTAAAVRAAVEEETRLNDSRVAQLEYDHQAAELAASEENAKRIAEKNVEVGRLKKANAKLTAINTSNEDKIMRLKTKRKRDAEALTQRDAQLQELRVKTQSLSEQKAQSDDTADKLTQAMSQLEVEAAEKDRIIDEMQRTQEQRKREMQLELSDKQQIIDAQQSIIAEKEKADRDNCKLAYRALSRKDENIGEWEKYADTLEDLVRRRDSKIEKLKGTIARLEQAFEEYLREPSDGDYQGLNPAAYVAST